MSAQLAAQYPSVLCDSVGHGMGVLRVRLCRGEAVRWLSPQDFVCLVHDAAERAGLPIVRSKGPRGRLGITPGPSLTPGYVSRSEYFDFELERPITGWEFRRRLSAQLPDGVEIVWQRRLPPRSAHLRAAVVGVDYTIDGSFDAAKADAFERAETWPLTRTRKDRERTLELKRSVARLALEPGRLILSLRVSNEGTPKPEEVIESICGIPREEALALPTERSAIACAPPTRRATELGPT